jgi:hypothetical protein
MVMLFDDVVWYVAKTTKKMMEADASRLVVLARLRL